MIPNIGQFDPQLFPHSPDCVEIIEAVSNYFGVPSEHVCGAARTQRIATARQVAMYLLRQRLGLGFTRIGELFNRDHSTVTHACKLIAERIEHQPGFIHDLL